MFSLKHIVSTNKEKIGNNSLFFFFYLFNLCLFLIEIKGMVVKITSIGKKYISISNKIDVLMEQHEQHDLASAIIDFENIKLSTARLEFYQNFANSEDTLKIFKVIENKLKNKNWNEFLNKKREN